jgi:hypothetical protein
MSRAALQHAPQASGKSAAATSLRIGPAHDSFEQEADQAAEKVTSGEHQHVAWSLSRIGFAPIQRQCSCGGTCDDCKKKKILQRNATSSAAAGSRAPASVASTLSRPGSSLDLGTRSFMESRFGHDFSSVRIHTDDHAAASARDVSANAYTVGSSIVFNQGKYQPHTPIGRKLLAHELAHVVQQTRTPERLPQRTVKNASVSSAQSADLLQTSRAGSPSLSLLPSNHTLEREAAQASNALFAGSPIAVQGSGSVAVARNTPEDSTAAPASAPEVGRIIREGRIADGGTFVEIEVGDAVARLGLEKTLPSGAEVNLQGWQRAHQVGPGLGAESGTGIRYAPPEVNLQYQNSGIEQFIRDFNKNKAPGVRLRLVTEVESHPNSLRLKSITYRLSAVSGQGRPRAMFEVEIMIPNVTNAPRVTLSPPEILGDWHEFLAPGRSVEPPAGGSGGGGASGEGTSGASPTPDPSGGTLPPAAAGQAGTAQTPLAPGATPKDTVPGAGSGPKSPNPESAAPVASDQSESATTGGKKAASGSVRVGTRIEVKNSTTNPDGSVVSELEYNFTENLEQLNHGAPAGGAIPARVMMRVKQSGDGAIVSVEPLSGQPAGLVEGIARRTLTPGALSKAGGGAAAGVAGPPALLTRGLKIGGWAAFAVITGHQLMEATPEQRPGVVAHAAGGLAGGALASYLACNAILDLETAGWGILICGFIASGVGGAYGNEVVGAALGEQGGDEMGNALHRLGSKDTNEQTLFNLLLARMGDSAGCIDASFVNGFLSKAPPKLEDSEVQFIASQLATMAVVPAAQSPVHSASPAGSSSNSHQTPANSNVQPPGAKGTVCPGCHGQSMESLQPGIPTMDKKTLEAFAAAPTCSAIRSSALHALKTAASKLPRYYRAPGDIAHHVEADVPTPPRRAGAGQNDFPSAQEQQGNCPGGNCHTPNSDDSHHSLIDKNAPLSKKDRQAIAAWVQQPSQKAPDAGNAHATPSGTKLPPSSSPDIPSIAEQQGASCPGGNCHSTPKDNGPLDKFGGFGTGANGKLTDADRQHLLEFLKAQQ